MHRTSRVLFASAWLLTGISQPSLAQTGTLQPSTAPRREEPARPPAAAPRAPVQKAASPAERAQNTSPPAERAQKAASPAERAHRTPVVTPAKPSHPEKPPQKAAEKPPEAPAAPAPAPAAPPAAQAPAAKTPPEKAAEAPTSDAPRLPRFAALRSDDVNMRAGPGTRYRIEWVYKRRDLPVEIEREFDVWRWVRDPDGIQGWVHQATLMGRRTFIIRNADATLRSEPSDTAAAVAVLKVGVIGRIRSCEASSAWCHVQAGSYRGYLKRDQFWGALPGEAINP